jgi:hypothetical protein
LTKNTVNVVGQDFDIVADQSPTRAANYQVQEQASEEIPAAALHEDNVAVQDPVSRATTTAYAKLPASDAAYRQTDPLNNATVPHRIAYTPLINLRCSYSDTRAHSSAIMKQLAGNHSPIDSLDGPNEIENVRQPLLSGDEQLSNEAPKRNGIRAMFRNYCLRRQNMDEKGYRRSPPAPTRARDCQEV